MEGEFWDKERHELRTRADQRFRARHPERRVSIVKKRDNVPIWKRRAHMKRHETVSGVAAKDRFGIAEDDGNAEEPHDRSKAMNAMRSWADKKVNWQETEAGSHPSPLASPHTKHSSVKRQRLERERKRRANTVISRIPLPTSSANRSRTKSSPKVKDGPRHVSEHQPSESEDSESSHDEDFQDPFLLSASDSNQSLSEHMKRHAEEYYPQKSPPKGMDNDHDPQLQTSDSGYGPFDDAEIIPRDFAVSNPTDEQRRDHVPPLKCPIIDQNTDETANGENEIVSDKGQKPNDQHPSPETPPDSNRYEHHSADLQLPRAETTAPLADASHERIPIGEHSDLEIYKAEESPENPSISGIMEELHRGSQPMSARSDYLERLDPQRSLMSEQDKSPYTIQNPDSTRLAGDESLDAQQTSSGDDNMKSPNQQSKPYGDDLKRPDLTSESPEPGGVTLEAISIQDQVREDNNDAEARLNKDAPLREDNRASSHASQTRPNQSYDAGSDKDSLIISPARSDELEVSEDEDWEHTAKANVNILRMIDECKANSQLEPTSEEQEARYWRKAKKAADKENRSSPDIDSRPSSISTPSSDASFLLSPGQYDEDNRTNAEPGLDDLKQLEEGEEEEEEEVDEDVMNLIELHRANYELRKDIEAKEAKFEQEIKVAWNRPRPPPVTDEQRRDKAALEKIESMEIFDELGEQQRPIKTDAHLIVRETQIDIMITRARTCYILEDYRRMYTRANQAAEAASSLSYPPLMARCCYYRGMASYHHGDFSSARDDFVEARGCAGLFGITSQSIERYIQLIDSGVDPETAKLERFSVSRGRNTRRTRARRSESLASSADAATLVGELPKSTEHPSDSPIEEDHPTDHPHDDLDSQSQISRGLSHTPAVPPPNGDPRRPATDGVPTYQPQDEAISESIRKDILESKARSLNDGNAAAASNVNTTQRQKTQDMALPAPSSLAVTEQTLYGTATTTSPGPGTRRVPRPHVAPITTSLAPTTAARDSMREHAPDPSGNMDDSYERASDEMGSDEIYAAFGGRFQEGETPDTASTPVSARWSYK